MLTYEESLLIAVKKQSKQLAKDFTEVMITESSAYYQRQGRSVGKFKTSDVVKTLKVVVDSNEVKVVAQDYIENLDRGRKPRSKKVPIAAILRWLTKAGLPKTNALAFAIQASIYKRGIVPRKFLVKAMKGLEESIGKIADKTFDKLTEKL